MSNSVAEIEAAIQKLFDALERIAKEHEEFTDTDVREAVHLTLNYYFVWGNASAALPVSFGMWGEDSNQRIHDAIDEFIRSTSESNVIPVGQERLNVLQAPRRAAGGMEYDELFGHRNSPLPPDPLPRRMFERKRRERKST